jgi:predicted Rossmann fold flavoprotein
MNDTELLILGGGASGLAAAIEAARLGAAVTVLEKLDRVGKKILATGNGRCNFLNLNASPADYNDPPFVGRVFAQFDVQSDLRFFRSMGLLSTADAEGRVYPRSNAASSVLDVLRFACARLGVRIVCGETATSIRRENELFIAGAYRARAVIVACGGKASPAHGTDGSGYRLLESFGHTCTPVHPALVQLRTDPDFVRGLKGLRASVALTLRTPDGEYKSAGEALFTDYGLSGIAAMDLARYAEDGGTLFLDFLPDMDEAQTLSFLREAKERGGGSPLEQLLLGAVHSRIGQAVMREALRRKLSAPCETLTDDELRALAKALKAFPLTVRGTKGFADAQVTAGGIETSEFADTLESRRVPGLFACGEILNVDGKCGGYNLTFAWSSGRLAGRSAAQYLQDSPRAADPREYHPSAKV